MIKSTYPSVRSSCSIRPNMRPRRPPPATCASRQNNIRELAPSTYASWRHQHTRVGAINIRELPKQHTQVDAINIRKLMPSTYASCCHQHTQVDTINIRKLMAPTYVCCFGSLRRRPETPAQAFRRACHGSQSPGLSCVRNQKLPADCGQSLYKTGNPATNAGRNI